MKKEAKTQVEIQVGIEALWKALAKDFSSMILKTMPDFIQNVEIIEGDGGPGTVFLFEFSPSFFKFDHTSDINICTDATNLRFQKEKLVDFEETKHQVGLEVVEGGALNVGFSKYKTIFQLTEKEKSNTLVTIKVIYEYAGEHVAGSPDKTLKAAEIFIQRLGNYLLKEVIA